MSIFTHLNWLDVVIIILFFGIITGISVYYSIRGGKDLQQFFLSGRNLPWYLAGTAMVATTFAADTPLAVTELVARNGIAGNWLWWNMAIGGLLTVFFFAKLWRRSGILTDLELIEFRYSGKPAAYLRAIKSIYLGLFLNVIIIGWVHEAMEKIFLITFPGVSPFMLVVILALIIGIYSAAAGLTGTIRTDSFQFVFALAGCIILAVIVVNLPEVGGVRAMKQKLSPEIFHFFPRIQNVRDVSLSQGVLYLTLGSFIAYAGVQWWSSWYPGADPGGGGYVAQRMMSAKDEKHSFLATLWFNTAHYALRPWPWILVALAALIILPRADSIQSLEKENPALFSKVQKVYNEEKHEVHSNPELTNDSDFMLMFEKYENTVDPGVMYPKLMVRYLPAGLLGLLIAVFLAAYMSTVASQLNWGTSYVVNDFYKRFLNPCASQKHYVLISRLGIMLLLVISLLISRFFLTTVSGAWEFIINSSAGIGAVLILRWYWWRINAWSEIAAMISPLFIYPIVKVCFNIDPPLSLFPTTLGVTLVWLIATMITKPEREKTLSDFYKKVHPGGIGWKKLQKQHPEIIHDTGYGKMFLNWGLGVVCIYSFMYFTGNIIFGEWIEASISGIISLISGFGIYKNSE